MLVEKGDILEIINNKRKTFGRLKNKEYESNFIDKHDPASYSM